MKKRTVVLVIFVFLFVIASFFISKSYSSLKISKAEAQRDCETLSFCQEKFKRYEEMISLASANFHTGVLSSISREFAEMANENGVLDTQEQYFMLISIRLKKRVAEIEGHVLSDEIDATYAKIFVEISKKLEACGMKLPNI
ncbi:MAG: hypothetical protein COX29_00975 [Candidatus Moranbacteria bacterium CG23_combo_of_CG06-09_8_20_14_all_35_22]|nr:MAG: hypothetical protein COX29_00975 [Candidatus Moranbacteria bacterium CG23_combo_of_CG06-09_8_20_14_all_35_22]